MIRLLTIFALAAAAAAAEETAPAAAPDEAALDAAEDAADLAAEAAAEEPEVTPGMRHEWNKGTHEAAFELLNKYELTAPIVPVYQTASMALHGVLVTAKLCEPTCMTEMNGICEQWYDATVGPPCRPAAALTLGMFATWLSTIVAVLVIVAKGLLGSKAKRA